MPMSQLTRLSVYTQSECHQNYYTQQFLVYIAQKTNNQDIIDFVNDVIDKTPGIGIKNFPSDNVSTLLRLVFDIGRSFIDKQQIIVPSFRTFWTLDSSNIIKISDLIQLLDPSTPRIDFSKIIPIVDNKVDVPSDGFHLEVARGRCELENLPHEKEKSVELEVKAESRSDA